MIYRFVLAAVCIAAAGACQARTTGPTPVGVSATESTAVMHEQDVPFKVSLTGTVTHVFANPRNCAAGYTTISQATGTASHMGLVTYEGWHCPTPAGMIGEGVLTAANGDKRYMTYVVAPTNPPVLGQPLSIVGTITIVGGTGRFADASGTGTVRASVIFEGYEDLEWPAQWEVEGRFSY
jgi:hypothetical protein